jgi:hypothetical protein
MKKGHIYYSCIGYYYNKIAYEAKRYTEVHPGIELPTIGIGLYCETWLERNLGIGHSFQEMIEIAKERARADLERTERTYEAKS